MQHADKLETLAIDSLVPYARNARTHSADQVAAVARSIQRFGFTNPVLIDAEGGIVAGHGRVLAAKSLGMESVPCLRVGWLTEAEKRAYVLADNKLAEMAGWDDELLAGELRALQAEDFDLSLTGFAQDELDDLLIDKTEGKTDPDAVPPAPTIPVTQPGDVWVLGRHRIMCGDSTDAGSVALLMGGMADMVFTDPPYNVAYEGRGANDLGVIKNDDMSDDQFESFLRDVFTCCWMAMHDLAVIYVCHTDSAAAPKLAFEKTFSERFRKSSTLIWCKQSAGMGWQDYRAQHEPILYGWKEGKGSHYYCGDRSKTTVWTIGRDAQSSYVHPTQKPVALPGEAIGNSSRPGDTVLDLFGGSGSTLIACEKMGRVNRSMELDPKYCDVIVRRWQDFTGQRAVRESDGMAFPA